MEVEFEEVENIVVVLAGLPTSFIDFCIEKGWDKLEFDRISLEEFRKTLNEASKVILAVRHEPTKKLILELIEDKNKVEERLIVDNETLLASEKIIVAPKQLKERGKDVEVVWKDLTIIRVSLYKLLESSKL